MGEVPRRSRLDLNEPAELAIHEAMEIIEGLPADEKLTEAVVLLDQAKSKVSDFIDQLLETHEYYYLEQGDVIQEGDEIGLISGFSNNKKWRKATVSVGLTVPPQSFMPVRVFRRLIPKQ